MILYFMSILIIPLNIWVASVGICVFSGVSEIFGYYPNDLIFNYNTTEDSSKNFSIINILMLLGYMVSNIVGGLFLDNLPEIYLVILATCIYLCGSLPLLVIYIKNRHNKLFNNEAISNAYLVVKDNKITEKSSSTPKKLVLIYFLIYSLSCVGELNLSGYSLYIYLKTGSYSASALMWAGFELCEIVVYMFMGFITSKLDITKIVVISYILSGMTSLIVLFNLPTVPGIILMSAGGFLYPFIQTFVYNQMLTRSQVVGCTKKMFEYRYYGYSIGNILCVFLGLATLNGMFIVMLVSDCATGILLPYTEEKTRKIIVDDINKNDIK